VDGIVSIIGKEDVCNAEIFNLGTEEENSTARGIEIVEEILGLKIKMKQMSRRPGDQSRTKANIDKARRLLDYNPKTTLKEGLEAQVKWFSEK
jgi:nucleoside-diphosphate-sugar epimerase